MTACIPPISFSEFAVALTALAPVPLAAERLRALYAHFEELRRWSEVLSLIGPGSAPDLLVRHYGESLAALPFLPAGPSRLLDLGSGAGFPGLILAAARPDLEVTLVEAREKKWAFLEAAARKAALSCHCLNARVAAALPPGLPLDVEVLTVRALKLPRAVFVALMPHLAPAARLLFWVGVDDPVPPPGFRLAESLRLAGGEHRRLCLMQRQEVCR